MFAADVAARINSGLDTRSISFENPTGARGAGGVAAGGRKGSPSRWIKPGEKVVLADIEGPGRISHIWMTFMPDRPEEMRAVWMEVYYDDLASPSISVPCLDFFGLPLGRPAAYDSAMTSVHEGRGFNAYFPMPFRRRLRFELSNGASKAICLYYQVDYSLAQVAPDDGYLHVPFHRQNPTVPKEDFVVASGLEGPGRFLGAAVGVRVCQDGMQWYGEGEFKVYRDGDTALPTICGTGLEDYVGTAWGMGRHSAMYAGCPICVAPPAKKNETRTLVQMIEAATMPDFVGFYRWHLPDPVVFRESFTATIQQIGTVVASGPHARDVRRRYTAAGHGWATPGSAAWVAMLGPNAGAELPADTIVGLAERSDDYSAAAFVYCRDPQPVPRLNVAAAIADIGLKEYEARPQPSL